MDRTDAPQNLKWNLTDIFASHNEWEKEFDLLSVEAKQYSTFKSKLKNKQVLLSYFKFEDEFSARFEKLNSYTFLNHDIALKDMTYIEDLEKLSILENKITELSTYILPELKEIDDIFYLDILKDEDFKNYKYEIEDLLN